MTDHPPTDEGPSPDAAEQTHAAASAAATYAAAAAARAAGAAAGEGDAGAAPPEHPDGEGAHGLQAAAAADPRSRSELLGALLEAEARRDEYLDDLRRSHAELENYRKRVLRDAAAQRESGRNEVAEALLEVLDDLDRTRAASAGSPDPALAKGVELVATKLGQALASVGLERVDACEVAFDPTVHEAVQQLPADEPVDEPQVAQVLRPGYRLGERTLRAAMVVVRG